MVEIGEFLPLTAGGCRLLWLEMVDVVPARTLLTPHPPSPPTVLCLCLSIKCLRVTSVIIRTDMVYNKQFHCIDTIFVNILMHHYPAIKRLIMIVRHINQHNTLVLIEF